MDILDRLEDDHRRLKALLKLATKTIGPERDVGYYDRARFDGNLFARRFSEFIAELARHEALESLYLTPLLRQSGEGESIYQQMSEGHLLIHELLTLCSGAAYWCREGGPTYAIRNTFETMRAGVLRHMEYEERSLFPYLRRTIAKSVLEEIERRTTAKLSTHPH